MNAVCIPRKLALAPAIIQSSGSLRLDVKAARILFVFLGLFFGLLTSSPASPSSTPPAPPSLDQAATPLVQGKTFSVEIPAHGNRLFTIAACAGCFIEVQLEQKDLWMPVATLSGPGISGPLPRACDAGIHSIVRVPFIASQAAEYTLEIHIAKAIASPVQVTLAIIRPAELSDRDIVAAYDAMARAEQLRHQETGDAATRAIATYDRTSELAQKTGDQLLRQQALVGKSRVDLYRTGNYLAGLKTAQQAVALTSQDARSTPQEQIVSDAAAWKILSSAYSFLARYPEMIEATRRSLALYTSLGDLYWQGILEGNAANVYLETGDMQHALSSAEMGLSIARRLSDADGISFTLATIAMIHDLRGEYQATIDASEEALENIRKNPYPDEEGQIWAVLGGLYDELNDPGPERDALSRALPLLRKSGDVANQSMALSELALLNMRQGRLHDAEQAQQQSMEIARSHDLSREQATALLSQAILNDREGHSSKALGAVHDGLTLAHKAGEASTSAMLDQELGDLLARAGNSAAALDAYRDAENSWTSIPNLENAALARASIARLEWRSSDSLLAQRDILEALGGFEASRRNIGGRSLRESFFASVHDFYDLAIEMILSYSLNGAANSSSCESPAIQSLAIAEHARARSLMDAIRESSTFSMRSIPQSLIDRSADIEKDIGRTQQNILRLSLTEQDRASLIQAKENLHSLVLKADEVEAHERAASSASLFNTAWRVPSIESLRAHLLDSQTVLLEYWVGKRYAYLWLVTAESVQVVRLGSTAELAFAIGKFRHDLLARENNPPNESLFARSERITAADHHLQSRAALLGRLLLPIRLPAQTKRLILVPDGIIASVPFAALRPYSRRFLIQDDELLEEPSASVAMEILSHRAPSPVTGRIAIYADPVYNVLDPRLASAHQDTQMLRVSTSRSVPAQTRNERPSPILRSDNGLDLSSLPRLRGSGDEAQAIAAIAGADRVKLFLGFHATPAQVMQTPWNTFSIAHFAAHAIADSARPELSGIVLSTFLQNGSQQDGVLWLHDIYRTPMPVSLVVLSGCRTATGTSIPGEGITGLAQAFLSAGASTVVGSLWTVDDAAASAMIPQFYRSLLQQNQSAAGALRTAQIRMIEANRPAYDWAGYIVEGNSYPEITPAARENY